MTIRTSSVPGAPTPFTADEIRRGCPEGRTIQLLVEPDGADPVVRVNRYVDCDADGATIERSVVTADGPLKVTNARDGRIALTVTVVADSTACASERTCPS